MSAHGEQSLLNMVSKTVAAYVSGNAVPPEALPDIIRSVHMTFASLEQGDTAPVVPNAPEPVVPVKKSVFPDYIVCLEDGKKLKMLKRYLQTAYGMTPDDYRQRWNLPSTYPMVAPNYAAKRSALAKSIGLGTRPQDRDITARPSPAEVDAHEPKPDAEPKVQVIKAGVRGRKNAPVA
jgi:predicted transcriptional regulator